MYTFTAGGFGQVDLNDNPIERTRSSHPYSYDEFVVFRNGTNSEINSTIYSDRLKSWDYELTEKLSKKHFGETGDYYTHRSPSVIEKFLQERLELPELRLVVLTEGCNVSNGYPYWVFHFNKGE